MNQQSQDLPQGKDPVGVGIVFVLAGALVLATVSLTFAQVILRTVFNNPQAWAEEVSRYLFAWIVFLGTAVAFARDTHIRIDVIDVLVGRRTLAVLKIVRVLVVLGAAGVMIYAGTLVAWRNRFSMFYTLPWFPQVLFYAVIPLCGALTVFFVLWKIAHRQTDDSKKTPKHWISQMSLVVLLLSFLVFLAIGSPVTAAMILSGSLSLFFAGMPINIVAERLLSGVNSYTLLAVPFFIFAAVIMNRGGLTDRLLGAAASFVGHFRGGVAQVDVLASIFFAGMSGSATADAASQGRILIPHMQRKGYDIGFAAGVNSASATIGAIIPPSITMIIYGSVTSISVGALFLAGILPGLLVGFGMMIIVAIISRRRNYPRDEQRSLRQRVGAVVDALPALFAPVIILGAIFTGIATPTEAGVIACVYALVLGFLVYRELKPTDIPSLLKETVEATAVPVSIIASASVFGFALTASGFGFMVEQAVTGLTDNPLVFLGIVVLIFFIVGLVIEGTAALLIFVPIFWPMIGTYGINELQFALVVIVTILVGTITPPVGIQLFIAADIAKISVFKVEIWPFVAVMMAVVALMIAVPGIVTIVPDLLMPAG